MKGRIGRLCEKPNIVSKQGIKKKRAHTFERNCGTVTLLWENYEGKIEFDVSLKERKADREYILDLTRSRQ